MFEKLVSQIYNKIYYPTVPNLLGDRIIEYGFVAANIDETNKKLTALDFGSSTGQPALIAAMRGYKVLAIDLMDREFQFHHKNVNFKKLDLLTIPESPKYDLIIVCSTIEHVGLAGRYDISKNDKEGDLKAAKKIHTLLNKSGRVVLTIPVGKDGVYQNLHRVYGKNRLPKLLEGFKIRKEEYWTKHDNNTWAVTNKAAALVTQSGPRFYSLGLFVLEK